MRDDIEILPADEPKQRKLGWTVTEEQGVAISNPRNIGEYTPSHISVHYLILDKNNMPVGDNYKDVGPIDTSYEYKDDLWLYGRLDDEFKLLYKPEEHRVYEAEIGKMTMLAGNGNWCDKIRFRREVPKEEILFDYTGYPAGTKYSDVKHFKKAEREK